MERLLLQKNNCFLAFPIYWLCRSFKKHVFCESVMFLLVQKSLNKSLSMSSLAIHLSILGNSVATISRLFFLLCFITCFSRNCMEHLSGVFSIKCHQSFW